MKEFSAQTGGRYTYVDDIVNLQELALSFASIFTDCDNFIISGCEVSGTQVSAGYIYLNGKIRHFAGGSGISRWPQYIYENNYTETVAYASGSDKVGRSVYGCTIGPSVPANADPLTNATPKAITIPQTGGLRMKDALYGKYALLLNATSGNQTVNGVVNFTNNVNLNGVLTSLGGVSVASGTAVGRMYNNAGQLVIYSKIGSGVARQIVIDDTNNIAFFIGGTRIARITSSGLITEQSISAPNITGGSVHIGDNHVYNRATPNNGFLYINYVGYNGGTTYYRTTVIGNGKQRAIVTVNGIGNTVRIDGVLTLNDANAVGLLLKTNMPKTSSGLSKMVSWIDSNDSQMAYIGYNNSLANDFEIKNTLGQIRILGNGSVNIGPAIMEDGTLLSNKYALITNMNTELNKKANSVDVYTKTAANSKFATLDGGLTQFIGAYTAAQLRSQIGAIDSSAVSGHYAALDQFLADMVSSEADKNRICHNIGAARPGDFQQALRDTGWIKISGTSGLYARQIGHIVSIQGTLVTVHSGTVFTLPNPIDAPTFAVAYEAPMDCNCDWGCRIAGGSKNCTVIYCNHHGKTIQFSLTYMV